MVSDSIDGTTKLCSFDYDHTGTRVSADEGAGPRLLLIDSNNHTGYAQVVAERDPVADPADPTHLRDYILGDDVLGFVDASGASGGLNQTYLCDGHGSVRGVATLPSSGDPAMARSRTYDYDA